MKTLFLLLLAAAPAAAAGGWVAGEFDAYTFALTWEPAFCETKPAATECASQRADRFDASNLALHGLWPDKNGDARHEYGFCGVDEAVRALDKPETWCKMPELPLSDATRVGLSKAMPGFASCLERHEWYKHGSCSGMTPDAFFDAADALVAQVAKIEFGRYVSAHAGKTVETEEVLAAFEKDFGPGSRSKISLHCAGVHGAQALTEVWLHLANPLAPPAELKSMLLVSAARGNCPSSFLLDPIPAR